MMFPVSMRHPRPALLHLVLATNLLAQYSELTAALDLGANQQPCGTDNFWSQFEGACYHAGRGAASWFKARRDCLQMGGDLASIRSEAERDFIRQTIPETYPEDIWIGLYESETGRHTWSDGSPEVYLSFAKGQPDDKHGSERCVIMSRENGDWHDQNCMKGWNSYVCKKHKGGSRGPATLAPPVEGSCPDGFLSEPVSNKCFFLGGASGAEDRISWQDARRACKTRNPTAELASISGRVDQAFAALLLEDAQEDVWIGMNNLEAYETYLFTWIDSSEVTHTYWAANRPAFVYELRAPHKPRQCVVMKRDPANVKDTAKWSNENCRDQRPYLCQVGREPSNTRMAARPFALQYIGFFCRDGYFRYHGRCYKFQDRALNWYEARRFCKGRAEELALTMDTFEVARLYYETLSESSAQQRVWLGVRYDKTVGEHVWGENYYGVSRTFWDSGEPDLTSIYSCVSLHNGFWDDLPCTIKLPFFCVEGDYAEYIPTTPHPTGGWCEDPDSVSFADHCYLVSPTDSVPWAEASRRCFQRGMELASINSHSEMRFLISLVQVARKGDKGVWIGLLQGLDNTYRWTDGAPRNYFNWAYGEPSVKQRRHGGAPLEQECVEILYASGEWNDLHCDEKRGYVCKSRKVFESVATTAGSVDTSTTWEKKKTGNKRNHGYRTKYFTL